MESSLLWIDAALNLLLGIGLLAFPPTIVQGLGLPETKATSYPRVFGGVLVGIAIALAVEATVPSLGGLGHGGAIAINLSGAAVLSGCLVVRAGDIAVKGQFVLWAVVILLILLSAVELSVA